MKQHFPEIVGLIGLIVLLFYPAWQDVKIMQIEQFYQHYSDETIKQNDKIVAQYNEIINLLNVKINMLEEKLSYYRSTATIGESAQLN